MKEVKGAKIELEKSQYWVIGATRILVFLTFQSSWLNSGRRLTVFTLALEILKLLFIFDTPKSFTILRIEVNTHPKLFPTKGHPLMVKMSGKPRALTIAGWWGWPSQMVHSCFLCTLPSLPQPISPFASPGGTSVSVGTEAELWQTVEWIYVWGSLFAIDLSILPTVFDLLSSAVISKVTSSK